MIRHLVARPLCRPKNWTLLAPTSGRITSNVKSSRGQIKCQAFSTTSSLKSGNSGESEGEFRHSDELLKERYDLRSSEDLDRKRARLLYQSRKRGMLENGVILASFADKFLKQFDAAQLDQYDRLINLPTNDWDIFYWATKTKPTPPEYETPVMAKLREHLKSKVSKSFLDSHSSESSQTQDEQQPSGETGQQDLKSDEESPKYNVLGKTRPNDIVVKPVRKNDNPYTFNVNDVSTVDFRDQLYDEGSIRLPGGNYIQKMTDWRKNMIANRIKRSLSAPISARNMTQAKSSAKIYTQRLDERSVMLGRRPLSKRMIDSKRDRLLKHHNFMQHLMSSEFTDNALDYDDEAEAWAEMVWHRNYGQVDDKISPTQLKCIKCASRLQCCDTGLTGYVPKEVLSKYMALSEDAIQTNQGVQSECPTHQICQRCLFMDTYDATLTAEIHRDFYIDYLESLRHKPSSIVCVLVDLTDLPGSLWPGLLDHIGGRHRVIVVGNKLDLLPYDGSKIIERVTYSLRKTLYRLKTKDKNLKLSDVVTISARTGFGIEALVSRLWAHSEVPRDIHLVGCNNSGKSTLFNALAQSDISAARQGDLISRLSTFECPGTHMRLLRFPAALVEEWQIELKKRKTHIVERNHLRQEQALSSHSEMRQETMPHMSLLINRLEFDAPLDNCSTSPTLAPPEAATEPLEQPILDGVIQEEPEEVRDTALQMSSDKSKHIEDSNPEIKFTQDHPLARIPNIGPLTSDEIKYPEHRFVYHSPSCYNEDQIHTLLTNDERLEVFPNETIVPRKYSLRPLQSILVSGLGRLDLLTSQSNVILSVFVSRYLPIHVISTRKADEFYNTFLGSPYLGIPFGDSARLSTWPGLQAGNEDFIITGKGLQLGAADVVLGSIGWVLVNLIQDQECILRAHAPAARGIALRDPPLLAFANKPIGRKIRDTPLFKHPHYTITETSGNDMGKSSSKTCGSMLAAAAAPTTRTAAQGLRRH